MCNAKTVFFTISGLPFGIENQSTIHVFSNPLLGPNQMGARIEPKIEQVVAKRAVAPMRGNNNVTCL